MAVAGWQHDRPSVLMVYYEGTDTIAHLFAPFTPPWRQGIDRALFERYRDAAWRYYGHADRLLGELLDLVGPEANVVLCSDHGFTWGADRPRQPSGVHTPTAAWWHRDPGVLVMAGPDIEPLEQRRQAQILDLTPTLLALTGLPAGTDMTGTVIAWAVRQAVVARQANAVDYRAILQWRPPSAAALVDPSAAEVVARLRALGYLETPDEGGSPADDLRDESPRALMNLGTVLLEQGRDQEALAAYQKALELDRGSPGAWLKVGVALRRLGRHEEALAACRAALELGGGEAHREAASLGMAIALVELGRPGEAEQLLEAATTFLPDSFILWRTRADIALGADDLALARQAYGRASELADDRECLNRLAALTLRLDRDREHAAALWRRSLALDADQPEVRQALAALAEQE
jgi:tetratricopeptide (TPR) repeat protein